MSLLLARTKATVIALEKNDDRHEEAQRLQAEWRDQGMDCTAPGFLDSGLKVITSMLPRLARPGRVAPGLGFDSRTSQASLFVVCPLEFKQGEAEFLDRFEAPYPQDVLLQCADEALSDAIPFGLPHEAR